MKRAFWRGSGNLTGAVPSGWTLLNMRTGIKRGEQTCRDKVRTWQPGSRSINNTVDKELWNVFLKCDIMTFNGNWAEKVLSIRMSPHKKYHTLLTCPPMQGNALPMCSDGLSLLMLACQDIIQHNKP